MTDTTLNTTPIAVFRTELEAEARLTRRILERLPAGKADWRPHPKSMPLGQLAVHVAELPGWVAVTLDRDVWDMATEPYVPAAASTPAELLALHEAELANGLMALDRTTEAELQRNWVMREGDTVYVDSRKHDVIRHSLNQTVHHRAQLGVYLRLLDIPVPGTYGPSADEPDFQGF